MVVLEKKYAKKMLKKWVLQIEKKCIAEYVARNIMQKAYVNIIMREIE